MVPSPVVLEDQTQVVLSLVVSEVPELLTPKQPATEQPNLTAAAIKAVTEQPTFLVSAMEAATESPRGGLGQNFRQGNLTLIQAIPYTHKKF